MKMLFSLFWFVIAIINLNAQVDSTQKSYDKNFVKKYRKIALYSQYPGQENKRVIKKWKSDIKIYISGDSLNKIKSEVEKYIKILNPNLNNIKIIIVNDKDEANFLILLKDKLDHVDKKPDDFRFNDTWDDSFVMYKTVIEISKELTTLSEQKLRIQRFLLMSLGDFSCKDLEKNKIDCKICFTTSELTNFDLQILKAHYSDAIKIGMNEKEVTEALLDSASVIELNNEKIAYNSISKTFKVSYNPNIWKCFKDTLSWDVFFRSNDNLISICGKEYLTNINENNIEEFYRINYNKVKFKLKSFDMHTENINGFKIYIIDEECESKEPQFTGIDTILKLSLF